MPIDQPLLASVVDCWDVAPGLRRLVLEGRGIRRVRPPPGTLGPYLKLHIPDRNGHEHIRTYSLRAIDPDNDRLHIDIVLHGGESIGSRFATRARPGDIVGVRGPGVIPAPACANYLLAGDDTAIPAMAWTLEALPRAAHVQVILETAIPPQPNLLPLADRPEPIWWQRDSNRPSALARMVAEWTALTSDILLWVGAEAELARAIRRHARSVLRLSPERVHILNYWKMGRPEGAFDCLS